jgi:uncharacterized SAM-binding protein YcdF (DUF218 family)
MIKRLISLFFLAWVLGFAWFALLLPLPAAAQKTDAIVVLTGGPGRIDRALERLEAGDAKRLLISGVACVGAFARRRRGRAPLPA